MCTIVYELNQTKRVKYYMWFEYQFKQRPSPFDIHPDTYIHKYNSWCVGTTTPTGCSSGLLHMHKEDVKSVPQALMSMSCRLALMNMLIMMMWNGVILFSMSETYCIMIVYINSACYSNFSRLDVVLSQEAVNIRDNYVKANIQQ